MRLANGSPSATGTKPCRRCAKPSINSSEKGKSCRAFGEALLTRGAEGDMADAQAVIDNVAKLPDDLGGVMRDIWLLRLRTLVAGACDDLVAYRELRDRYRAMATSFGFEGHMDWASAMP